MKSAMRFQKKGKYSPRYVSNMRRICKVDYEFNFPNDLAMVHPVFHVSVRKRFVGNPISKVPLKGLGVDDSLSYEEVPVEILDH